MKLIDRTDIEHWAEKHQGKGFFPYLVSKLVYFSTLPGAQISIPYGSAVYLPGWDGLIYSEQQRPYVPAGRSLWEFGTDKGFRAKADRDFDKRAENPLGYDASDCTYVFVTPRIWKDKEAWRLEKLKLNLWKDICVYDAVDMTQWLDQSGPAALWFAREIGKAPAEGALDAEQFWAEWSSGEAGHLVPKIVTSGRDAETAKLSGFLSGDPGIITVQAKTKTEAAAFIIAAADSFDQDEKQRFFSKTMVVENQESFRTLSLNYVKTSLNLIAKFDDKSLVGAAVSQGHHVIIPAGADDELTHKRIILPTIGREGQIEGLREMGLSREDAERFSREAGRDINKLRRLLKYIDNKAAWHKSENIREIIPALILGRWNINNPGDREILEKLSKMPFNDYLAVLYRWRDFEDSPILQIGGTWRLTSPLDLWNSLSKHITADDLSVLAEYFPSVFTDPGNSGETHLIQITFSFTPPKKYSPWAREGLVQTLILLSLYGEAINPAVISAPEKWVDVLVGSLLLDADAELWRKTNRKLPLIAEASPKSFFKAVQSSLQKDEPEIMGMFRTNSSYFGESSSHTGLLWALEGLAWLPEYLFQATDILLKLAELDPGGNLSNRPARSLADIYRPAHPQTAAALGERMEILKAAISRNPKSGWELLRKLMPKHHDNWTANSRMRWRLFDKSAAPSNSPEQTNEGFRAVSDLMLEMFDGSDGRLADIIRHSSEMSSADEREKLLVFIEKNYARIPKDSTLSRDEARRILHLHRSASEAPWALDEEILSRYQPLYDALEPEDITAKYRWLFESSQVNFPQGARETDDDEKDELDYNARVLKARTKAIHILSAEIGIQGIAAMADSPEITGILAFTLSRIEQTKEETAYIVSTLKNADANANFVSLYIAAKTAAKGLQWLFVLCSDLEYLNLDDKQQYALFSQVDHSQELWDYIESKGESLNSTYWLTIPPYFYRTTAEESISAVKKLMEHKRFKSALRAARHIKRQLSTQIIAQVLHKTATEESIDNFLLELHEVTSLFKEAAQREDITKDEMLNLEWLYLSVLNSYHSDYRPSQLYGELADNPHFFVDVLSWHYTPADPENIEPERKNIPKENLEQLAQKSYELLDNFMMIPGVRSDNTIDNDVMDHWIAQVRELAQKRGRLEAADSHIGMLLAYFPEEGTGSWPPDEISAAIERINTPALKDNFAVTLINKRGSTGRGVFEGGTIEKNNAAYFQKLAGLHKYSHPSLSEIFIQISENYLNTAGHHDDQAERDRLEY
ncbi:hypothetical protein NYQ10_15610 [Flavobacterium johnsoniae]|uniref:Uncharacterized protein n=1 Tax=Flavobacterium sp. CFS9 TaxID=3143118 RepID=A0AAT9H6Q7_9FLAO|nr:hypothetical protein [Flavobacterium johnsoniae]WJS93518.1 hypothetical protein NYQ10_15610 [Flavobacterium johnsoniae]